ncbi:hypothetical protein [Xaviernesmea oryzae]|nr:hypothetical protein [Xaviernesmea oryzae]
MDASIAPAPIGRPPATVLFSSRDQALSDLPDVLMSAGYRLPGFAGMEAVLGMNWGANIARTVAFVAPLAGLTLLMGFGERLDDDTCPQSLAFEKSQQIVEERPGVVDMAWRDFRWVDDCRFALGGYADIATDRGVDRTDFELVVAFDPQTHRWQQISLSMTQ